MHFNASDITAVFAVLGFLFVCVGFVSQWRVSKNTAALTQYRDIAKGWEEKSRLQEIEIADLQDGMRKKNEQIAQLQGQVTVLRDTVTGKASWDVLDHKITEALNITAELRTEIRQMHELLIVKKT